MTYLACLAMCSVNITSRFKDTLGDQLSRKVLDRYSLDFLNWSRVAADYT